MFFLFHELAGLLYDTDTSVYHNLKHISAPNTSLCHKIYIHVPLILVFMTNYICAPNTEPILIHESISNIELITNA